MTATIKPVYVVLTRPKTITSDCVYLATHDKYTHSAISLTPDLKIMYSFGRRFDRLPLPGCFVCENFESGVFARLKKINGTVIRLDASEEEYDRLVHFLRTVLRNRHSYKYNYIGWVHFMFGIGKHDDMRYTCSEFVATALAKSGIIKFDNHLNLIKPYDFTSLPGRIVFEGDMKEYIREEAYKHLEPGVSVLDTVDITPNVLS